MGVIQKSNSRYLSPAFPIFKKNGSIRIVIDYREINKRVDHIRFPLPKIQDALLSFWIDLRSGYYQLKVEQQSKKFTAFTLNGNIWEFNLLPFGLKNAPHTFQKAMKEIFGEFNFIKLYLNDCLIHSKSESEHYLHLFLFLEKAWNHGLSLNFDKSSFIKQEVYYLGHKISPKGIKPDVSRITSIFQKIPINRKQIEKILGTIQWFRPFLKNKSFKTSFLTELLTKNTKFKWKESYSKKLKEIENEIKKETLISYPDFEKHFSLQCDASLTGAGAVLFQEQKILGFFSYLWKKHELSYSITEKETFCLVKAIIHFKTIIFGSDIKVFTDNNNATFNKPLTARSQRWKILIEQYGVRLYHLPASLNTFADTLSRLCYITNSEEHQLFDLNLIYKKQQEERQFALDNNFTSFPVADKLLLFDSKKRCYIPESYANEFLIHLHTVLQHPGLTTSKILITRYFHITTLQEKLSRIVRNCLQCQQQKSHRSIYGVRTGEIAGKEFLELVCLDIMGPFDSSEFLAVEEGRKLYILAVVDVATRWTEIKILKTISAKAVKRAFTEIWLQRVGTLTKILTDRGTQFSGETFKLLCRQHSITHTMTSPYHPESNGVVERINSVIRTTLRINKGKTLSDVETHISRRINFVPDRITKRSPHELRFNISPLDIMKTKQNIDLKEIARTRTISKQSSNEVFNKYRIPISYKPGNKIYLRNRLAGKIDARWLGPFVVLRVIGNGQIEFDNNGVVQVSEIYDLI